MCNPLILSLAALVIAAPVLTMTGAPAEARQNFTARSSASHARSAPGFKSSRALIQRQRFNRITQGANRSPRKSAALRTPAPQGRSPNSGKPVLRFDPTISGATKASLRDPSAAKLAPGAKPGASPKTSIRDALESQGKPSAPSKTPASPTPRAEPSSAPSATAPPRAHQELPRPERSPRIVIRPPIGVPPSHIGERHIAVERRPREVVSRYQSRPQHTRIKSDEPVCVEGAWALQGSDKRYVCLLWYFQGRTHTPDQLAHVLEAKQSPAH
jgi:hypothetical protein